MKDIKILGTGCAKCNQLTHIAQQAANELGIPHHLEKVTDVMRFAEYGVMITPALVVDGKVKIAGKVPTLEEAKSLLSD